MFDFFSVLRSVTNIFFLLLSVNATIEYSAHFLNNDGNCFNVYQYSMNTEDRQYRAIFDVTPAITVSIWNHIAHEDAFKAQPRHLL